MLRHYHHTCEKGKTWYFQTREASSGLLHIKAGTLFLTKPPALPEDESVIQCRFIFDTRQNIMLCTYFIFWLLSNAKQQYDYELRFFENHFQEIWINCFCSSWLHCCWETLSWKWRGANETNRVGKCKMENGETAENIVE